MIDLLAPFLIVAAAAAAGPFLCRAVAWIDRRINPPHSGA